MAYKLTVREALQLPSMAGCEVLSGKAGLDREIRTVMVGDTIDIADWVSEGDMVISTVPFMKAAGSGPPPTEELLCRWARSVLDRKPCALGIKTMRMAESITDPRHKYAVTVRTRRYLECLPASLLALGDEYGIPIISKPAFAAQNEISRDIMWAIIGQYEEARKHALEAFFDICSLMVQDHTLGEVARRMQHYLGNPILIENEQLDLLAASGAHEEPDSLAAHSLRVRRSPEFLATLQENLPMEVGSPTRLEIPMPDGAPVTQETMPIIAHGRIIGFVSVGEVFQPITDEMRELLRTLVSALALDMAQQAYLETAAWQMRAQLLDCLLAPEFDERSCYHFSGLVGFDERREKVAMIVNARRGEWPVGTENPYYNYYSRVIVSLCTDYMQSMHTWAFICEHKGSVIVFVNTERGGVTDVKALACSLRERLLSAVPKDGDVSIGIGRSGTGLQACRASCLEAQDALQYIRDFDPDEPVVCYSDMGQHALLVSLLRDRDAARNYCQSILGKLIKHDRRESTDLLETLWVYLECNCSYVDAGKALFLHPKTIKYRIGQICEMLPLRLTSFNDRSTVWLALNIYKSMPDDV